MLKLTAAFKTETRAYFYGTVFGIWGTITLYAMLHDQYIVTIAPEHFTLYHPDLLEIEHARVLATGWAFLASIGPGLALGVGMYITGRFGDRPKKSPQQLIYSVIGLVAIAEGCALFAMLATWLLKRGIYPDRFYPDHDLSLHCTQSAQLTVYLVGFAGAGLLLLHTWRSRPPAA